MSTPSQDQKSTKPSPVSKPPLGELSRTSFPTPPLPRPASTKQHEIEMMYFTPLGAGSEVGRSCHILKFKGKNIMLDCGAHPAYNGLGALPFFDEIEPERIDLVLITHFHIDHCASLPYFMRKTNFKGRVFMTHPTKAIFKWMLSDYVRISNTSADDMPYDEQDLQQAYDQIEAIDFHQVMEVSGIRFSALNAGHVLGAAMFLIEIAGVKVLYTGDYSREEDRHLNMADVPTEPIDLLICEATYGVQNHTPRIQRETRFTQLVHQIVTRGGRCLVPMFALGRAQELLLILDEYWSLHPELQHIPIYYASNLARKCMAVYQTYISMMNQKIREQFVVKNPFVFKHIANLRSMTNFDDVGPCVMLASPAMLQSGLSRELLEMWCPDKKNGVIIPGYVVEGTLGKQLLSEPNEITSSTGAKLPVRCTIDYISFSAHVDFTQNRDFIEQVDPTHLILVHGETNMITRLKTALLGLWADREAHTLIHAPKNAESVALHFKGEKFAKALGSLAHLKDGQLVQGILVAKDFEYHLVTVQEISEFTDLPVSVIRQKQYVPLETGTWELVLFHLQMVYPEHLMIDGDSAIIYDKIKITHTNKRELIVEWDGHPIDDVLADSVLAVLLHVESSPVSVKLTHSPSKCAHTHDESTEKEVKVKKEEELAEFEELSLSIKQLSFDEIALKVKEELLTHLSTCYDHVEEDTQGQIIVKMDSTECKIDVFDLHIESENPSLKKRIQTMIENIGQVISDTWIQKWLSVHTKPDKTFPSMIHR